MGIWNQLNSKISMIIWLASYPRSGNTLLRTVLNQTMGLKSVSDEVGERTIVGQSSASLEITGITEIEGNWEEFYQKATQSREVFLVKTHRPPRDNQPAIYVVRDGRSACLSYSRFHQQFTRPSYPSLLDLILGCDFYGDWSNHYRLWAERDNTFIIRYEDLINISDDILKKISRHVHYADKVVTWKNPFSILHNENPNFFRAGGAAWQGDASWTAWIDCIFFYLHGNLMIELGYSTANDFAEKIKLISKDTVELLETSRRMVMNIKNMQTVCDERQIVIDDLKQVCDERLALINQLSSVGS